MTPIYICVHSAGFFSWHDQDTGHSVVNAASVPPDIQARVPDDERRRVRRRLAKIRLMRAEKCGLKDIQINRMMAKNRKNLRA